jgi:hypothetical protein
MTSFFSNAFRGFCGKPEMADAEERNSRIAARAAPLATQVLRQVERDSKTAPVFTHWTRCGGKWNFKVDPFLMRTDEITRSKDTPSVPQATVTLTRPSRAALSLGERV